MFPISLKLSPVEIKKLFDLAYGATRKLALKYDPVYGPRFINLAHYPDASLKGYT
jgi:hypothetical protein